MRFVLKRRVYEYPEFGIVRAQYTASGEFPLNTATTEGMVKIKLKLHPRRSFEDAVEVWHARAFDSVMAEVFPGKGLMLVDEWRLLTDPVKITEKRHFPIENHRKKAFFY